ncbi:acyl-CoA dehydrogenase family protein [Qaidamihabitans albus]|uniref:acyl-CoA dehydrogenase family protein n=1 Tax=Qaidamihabitans albus TaxID=2795733 RepID=UPI0018F23F58|nr:acyl-CoA dehydrogenase family protein [Qaidamihabitans albus]
MSGRVTGTGEVFRAAVREWLSAAVAGLAEGALDDVTVRREWDRKLYDAGLAGLTWPVEFGGRGLSVLEEYVFHEEAARAGAPEGYGRIGRILAGPLLIKHGSPEQRQRYLQPILSGDEVWCQGFSEPGAGSDLANVGTRAERAGELYRISGQKIWTSFADHANRCLLLARTSARAPRHRNLGMFLLDMRQPGVDVRPITRITGDTTFSEVHFDGAVVHERDLVGGETGGWRMAMAVLSDERGPIEAITRYTAMSRAAAVLRECCASGSCDPELDEVCARVETVRWHSMRSLGNALAGIEDRAAGSVSKLMWSHTWQALTAYGLGLGCPAHELMWQRQYLESRAATIFSGSTQIQRNVIAERVLGLPR